MRLRGYTRRWKMEKSEKHEKIWCEVCEDWIKRAELVRWTGDDALHWLCPGCDSDLLPVEKLE